MNYLVGVTLCFIGVGILLNVPVNAQPTGLTYEGDVVYPGNEGETRGYIGGQTEDLSFGHLGQQQQQRFKRATCDLLSFQSKWVTPNHAACAGHCLIKGFKGGKCKNAICHCRH